MNIREIRELAKLVRECELSALEVNEGETRIRLERTAPAPAAQGVQEIVVPVPAAMPAAAPAAPVAPTAAPAAVEEPAQEAPVVDFNRVTPVKSPMVGVFYAAPSPEKPPFVKVGDRVKKGDVLCIIEAMKLMNEITAEQDGEIADVCVANGDVVEFGQILFKIF